ncbi:MAG: hypothetical protein ACOCRX_00625 [Candidatus Woesearchaeota archaeon]
MKLCKEQVEGIVKKMRNGGIYKEEDKGIVKAYKIDGAKIKLRIKKENDTMIVDKILTIEEFKNKINGNGYF